MNRNPFFSRSRLYLTACYAGVMGLILSLTGMGIYKLVAWERWKALDQELHTLSVTLHDAIEPMLRQPGVIKPEVEQVLPGLCWAGTNCQRPSGVPRIHVLGVVQQSDYSVQLFNLNKDLIASAGQPGFRVELPPPDAQQHMVEDRQGQRYHLISLSLKTRTGQPWGYLNVGRSLRGYDTELEHLRLYLLLGFPLLLLLIILASWGLVGLAMQPVYRSYQQIQQFTADAAHELRTPLAAIRATVEATLHAEPLPWAEIASTLQTIARQNQRLTQLTGDLLLLSRLDLHLLDQKTQPCCLNEIVSDLVEEFAALGLAAGVKLHRECFDATPLSINGDEDQLYRLVSNLLTNAIHHTPPDGKVILRLYRDGQQVVLQVEDTGLGISPADQARIFDRFYRVGSDRSRQTGGAGLGLAIAKAIVQAHRGSIGVQSQPGKGSIFTVRFTIKPL